MTSTLRLSRCRRRLRNLQSRVKLSDDLPAIQRRTIDNLLSRNWAETLELIHEGSLELRITKQKSVDGKRCLQSNF